MAISLPDARELPDEVLEALRLCALRGCRLGLTETRIAEVLGAARETVSWWWSAYADHGVEALPHRRTGRPPGSGRVLTDAQAERIQHLLSFSSPVPIPIPARATPRRDETHPTPSPHERIAARPGCYREGPEVQHGS